MDDRHANESLSFNGEPRIELVLRTAGGGTMTATAERALVDAVGRILDRTLEAARSRPAGAPVSTWRRLAADGAGGAAETRLSRMGSRSITRADAPGVPVLSGLEAVGTMVAGGDWPVALPGTGTQLPAAALSSAVLLFLRGFRRFVSDGLQPAKLEACFVILAMCRDGVRAFLVGLPQRAPVPVRLTSGPVVDLRVDGEGVARVAGE